MQRHGWQALGTAWAVTIWDEVPSAQFQATTAALEAVSHTFDATYSRFKADSLVTQLSQTTGWVAVPRDMIAMLRLYAVLNAATGGKINPAIGFSLEDTGYDATYSLRPKPSLRKTPALADALTILSDTELELHEPVLLDFGALGKGYLIDLLYAELQTRGYRRFLVDGSGDIRHYSIEGVRLECGLEDPRNATKVIGSLPLATGALCASATNRRQWGMYHHYLDPDTSASPHTIAATFVTAPTAALADGISSALFFVEPEQLEAFSFEYLMINEVMRIKKSAGFAADIFT